MASGPIKSDASDPAPCAKEAELPFLIVGVGASAGGLDALNEFFAEVSNTTGVAFIVIQHLSPDFKSMMSHLVSKHTKITVVDAEDDMPVEPDHVYVLPLRADLRLNGGRITLSEARPSKGVNHPIDTFFESLAREQRENSACVVLSGSGTDGMRGVQAVKEAGGLVLVQEPSTTQFDGMPNSALSTGFADFVGSPAALAQELCRFAEHPLARGDRSAHAKREEAALDRLLEMIEDHLHVDFSTYKRSGVFRRMQRRLPACECSSLTEYVDYIREHPEELVFLGEAMLIGVTRFCRDEGAWAAFQSEVVQPLIDTVPDRTTIRAWVAGCSTGQEAYTLGVALDRAVRESGRNIEFRIFATDVDPEAIARAGSGEYTKSQVADIPEEELADYFDRRGELFVARRTIRDRITFASHNLLQDPPFTKLHLITCRNLLIYLGSEAQGQVMSRFEFALLPRGFLFLGISETVGSFDSVFREVNPKWKLFVRREGVGQSPPSFALSAPRMDRPLHKAGQLVARPTGADAIYEAVVARFAPPGLAIDDQFHIVHVFGNVGSRLTLPAGRVNLNLLKMVPRGAAAVLSASIRTARQRGEEVSCRFAITEDSEPLMLRIVPPTEKNPVLVFFEETQAGDASVEAPITVDVDSETARRVQELEEEGVMLRQNLQTAIQEHETANEELQATNEELIASNEELQSTNEELQSVNEELYTVNTEYQEKIGELEQMNEDLEHVLSATQAGILILDHELHIRRYNEGCLGLFPLLEQDVGRPLGDIAVRARGWEFEPVIRKVLESGEPLTLDVTADDHREWAVTGRCLSRYGTNVGVIVTMMDSSRIPQSVRKLDRLLSGLDAAGFGNTAVWVIDVDTGETACTPSARRIFGVDDDAEVSPSAVGIEGGADQHSLSDTFNRLMNLPHEHSMKRVLDARDAKQAEVRLEARISQHAGSRLLVAHILDEQDARRHVSDETSALRA